MRAENAQKAADARLKTALKHSSALDLYLTEIKVGDKTMQQRMPKIRAIYAELGQAIHEFNAYTNAATTGE